MWFFIATKAFCIRLAMKLWKIESAFLTSISSTALLISGVPYSSNADWYS